MRRVITTPTFSGAASVSLGTSVTGDAVRVFDIEIAAIQAVISGSSSLNGVLKLQASCDMGPEYGSDRVSTAASVTNWADIASSSQTVTTDGSNIWNISDIGYRWIRVVYARTGGTGTLALSAVLKGYS